ncbi:hypothetical protein [Mariniflexile sp. HMF6888]|uniref:hypothetical protein n=1 Tax=Mariniflexile sp. HMF6888 TaxID=3373086 RepID=UPI0037B11DD8
MKPRKIDAAYRKAIFKYKNNEGGIIDFIQNTLKINGLELLKIENDNSVSKITKGTEARA